ncbi:TetR/AcrR family transcriptional regulator [Actinomadura sp. KC345]|uniref:TetR/AcrR family transcriptional regulator n=1 Tax=Actinomadura sp. KC345 TaxID=2530371 RepID=UPI00104A7DD6|nr:TetR/AcrR family transcriptional regulator [Actinomadura sp. KC345]TDC56835.1 TetR/AcrR family transcriptional regulator [Actinomadura sp. KC345]
MARSPSGLRERLLDSSVQLFAQRGFRGTSLADVAADAGCSKASLLYHFSSKEAILAELLLPIGKEVVALDRRLAPLDDRDVAEAAVTGFVDLTLRYRREIKLLFDNLADVTSLPDLGIDGVDGVDDRLVDAVAGRSPGPEARVAAHLVLGGIFAAGAAVERLPFDDATLRASLTTSALRALGRGRA